MLHPFIHSRKRIAIVLAGLVTVVAFFSMSALSQDDTDRSEEAVALFNKGQDAHEKGDLTAALDSYEKALKLIPEFPEAELQRGNAYQALGKLDDAERAFRRATELRENWSLALANLGSVLVRKGRFAEAEKSLTQAIEIDGLNFPAYSAMTELRLRTKAPKQDLDELLGKIRSLTAKANPTASIWASRAALENAIGDRKFAKISAAKALEVDAKNQSALFVSADIALVEEDPAAAELFVKRLEALDPRSESVLGLRSRILVAQGKSSEALTLLNSVPAPGPEIVELKNQISGTAPVTTADLEKQLAVDPKNSSVLRRLCYALRVPDPAKALDYCRRASEAEPNRSEPAIGYAAALVQLKRYDEAVIVLRRLQALVPENSTVRANLATALFQLKRYGEAKPEFRWLTDHQPDQAIAYYFLGIVHDQLLEFADAAANYHQFLRLADPESSKLEIEKVNLRLPIVQKLLKEGKGKKRG